MSPCSLVYYTTDLKFKWNEIQSCELRFKLMCWVAMRGILYDDKLIQYRKLILMAYHSLPLSHQSTLSFTETWWRYMQLSSVIPHMCLQLILRFPKSTHSSQGTLIHASCDVLDRNKLLGTWYEQTVGHLIQVNEYSAVQQRGQFFPKSSQ